MDYRNTCLLFAGLEVFGDPPQIEPKGLRRGLTTATDLLYDLVVNVVRHPSAPRACK